VTIFSIYGNLGLLVFFHAGCPLMRSALERLRLLVTPC